jgi:anti-sigma factor RsiW
MSCTTCQRQLEAYVDGELAAADATQLEAHIGTCSACAGEAALARQIRAKLRSTPAVQCPDHILAAVERRLASQARDRHPIRQPVRARWYAAAALVSVLGVALAALYLRPTAPEQQYTADEIAEARQQVELAFALVGEAARDVSAYLREDVFDDYVFEPMRRDLGAH